MAVLTLSQISVSVSVSEREKEGGVVLSACLCTRSAVPCPIHVSGPRVHGHVWGHVRMCYCAEPAGAIALLNPTH